MGKKGKFNDYKINDDGTVFVYLTQDKVTIIDQEDLVKISQYRWCAAKSKSRFYSVASVEGKMVGMHRIITKPDKQYIVDHINGDTLDNRKNNLRVCTYSENNMNRGKTPTNSSGHKGVSWFEITKKWRAVIAYYGKYHHLGYFLTKEEAIKAYEEAATEHHGEFKNLG